MVTDTNPAPPDPDLRAQNGERRSASIGRSSWSCSVRNAVACKARRKIRGGRASIIRLLREKSRSRPAFIAALRSDSSVATAAADLLGTSQTFTPDRSLPLPTEVMKNTSTLGRG